MGKGRRKGKGKRRGQSRRWSFRSKGRGKSSGYWGGKGKGKGALPPGMFGGTRPPVSAREEERLKLVREAAAQAHPSLTDTKKQ